MKVWTADLERASLAARYRRIVDQVTVSALKVGRSPESITVVAVTKTVGPERMIEASRLGIRDVAESRVQEADGKLVELSDGSFRWHFIGHLQTNKVKRVVGFYDLIHSVDSWKLAEALSREATQRERIQPILIQVNISGEPSKFGISPDETATLVERIERELPGIAVQGLMTMAPGADAPEAARPFFRRLRELRDAIACPARPLAQLSMGMSQDYPVAVEEGATLIRIGSGLFGATTAPGAVPATRPE